MSADNGIYIGKFADGEIRVIEAQAIDNLWYPDKENGYYIWHYYQNGQTFPSLESAYIAAFKMADEMYEEGAYLEYGVSVLTFERTLEDYELEARTSPEYESYRKEEAEYENS